MNATINIALCQHLTNDALTWICTGECIGQLQSVYGLYIYRIQSWYTNFLQWARMCTVQVSTYSSLYIVYLPKYNWFLFLLEGLIWNLEHRHTLNLWPSDGSCKDVDIRAAYLHLHVHSAHKAYSLANPGHRLCGWLEGGFLMPWCIDRSLSGWNRKPIMLPWCLSLHPVIVLYLSRLDLCLLPVVLRVVSFTHWAGTSSYNWNTFEYDVKPQSNRKLILSLFRVTRPTVWKTRRLKFFFGRFSIFFFFFFFLILYFHGFIY